MAELATLAIRRDFPRPSAAQVARFKDAPSGYVVDAMGRRGALDFAIRPMTRSARFVGAALTIQTRTRDNLAPWAAIEFAKPGDVMIIAAQDSTEASVVGDLMMGIARNKGVVACVTDGLVRDVPGLDAVGLPVFARGVTPNSPFKTGPGSIGLPITIGGATVHPGDLLLADGDGVVVVPLARLDAVADELAAIRAKEAEMEARIKRGESSAPWVKSTLEKIDIVWVD
jgi:4-hydroxy-4-methyl-2-oxoglutarate aldolase